MDRDSEMAVFVRAVEGGGFSAAARDLGITPSAVSKLVGRLEDRLGARLLNRTTRSISLTEEGRTYYERAVTILEEIEAAELAVRELHAEPRGVLKVNSSTAFGRYAVIPYLHEFIEAYPELQVQFITSDSMVDLVGEGVDVGLRIGTLTDSSLIARRLTPVKRVVAGAPAYLERHGVPQTPEDLVNHNCLRVNFETSINRWEFKGTDGPRILDVNGSLMVNDASLLYDAAIAGVGLIRAAQFLTWEALRDGRLVPVLQEYETEEGRNVFAVYPPGRHQAPKVRAFVDWLVDRFVKNPPWAETIAALDREAAT
ncbi:MAG: LysR family transcriptional regulator [Rhodospirillales bacterium]